MTRRGMDSSEAYYALGLPPGSDLEDIKLAYRQRALQCHPDRSSGNSEEFIRITRAYDLLTRKSSPGLTSSPHSSSNQRYAPGRVVYASGFSGSRSSRTATLVWGVGLGLGGMLFAGILLLGRTMAPRSVYAGPSRVVEPTSNSAKRDRIASLLMEKAAVKAGEPTPKNKAKD